jgi:hypothetical protein
MLAIGGVVVGSAAWTVGAAIAVLAGWLVRTHVMRDG